MRTKVEYDSLVKFQEGYTFDNIKASLEEFWENKLKTRLEVKTWEAIIDDETIPCFSCIINYPKVEKERAMAIGTGIGGVANLLEDISREEFVLCYEVIYNGNPYDAGKFWDTIKQIKQNI